MSPALLVEWPELASLEVLAHTARVARAALLAANPELTSGDFISAVLEGGTLQACFADALVTNLDALDTMLGRYRDYVASRGPVIAPAPASF